jgi:hypothetical protein
MNVRERTFSATQGNEIELAMARWNAQKIKETSGKKSFLFFVIGH